MLKEIPKASGTRTDIAPADSSVDRLKPKKEVIKSLGFNEKLAERFETLADNKEIKGYYTRLVSRAIMQFYKHSKVIG
jgi:hypothetical protein